jgi:LPS sulfotransferase NodH
VTRVSSPVSSRLLSSASRRLQRLSLRTRLLAHRALSVFGHTDYVRFIILTRSRTGSTLLRSYLNSHRNIFVEGEIFGRLRGRDPLAQLHAAFGRQPRHIRAKGFKIFYYHPLDARADQLWDRLEALEDIRVIHLTRHNVLRTLLSRKIAGIKRDYVANRFDAIDPESKRIVLTVPELADGFRQTREWELGAADRFRRHPKLDVTYEELVELPQETYRKVLAFLGQDYRDPRTGMIRQNAESLRYLIRNYDELKAGFAGSPWEHYFDE